MVLLKENQCVYRKQVWYKTDHSLYNEEAMPFIFNIIMKIACTEGMLNIFPLFSDLEVLVLSLKCI